MELERGDGGVCVNRVQRQERIQQAILALIQMRAFYSLTVSVGAIQWGALLLIPHRPLSLEASLDPSIALPGR